MRDSVIGALALAAAAAVAALAFVLALDVVPGIIARMNPLHCSALFVMMMVLPFSKWIGEGVREALRTRRARSH